jgi:type VI secretion system protein ImpL
MELLGKLLRPPVLIGLAAVLVVVATLAAAAVLHWPALLVLLILAGLGLVTVIIVLIGQLKAARAAEDIESTITRQADLEIERSVPGQARELQDLKAELLAAIAALKQRRGGQAALSTLPWYMVVGPARSGKSTLLARSELQFPQQDEARAGRAVSGLGGTRGFGWWLCSEAVLLDMPGRWVGAAAQFEDTEDWLSFLRVLAKRRRPKPLSGVLVVIAIDQLADRPDDEVDRLAQGVRERLHELVHELGVVFPTYLVFTKADLLAGFTEHFADLTPDERGQAWGATFDLERARGENAAELFDAELHHLGARLSERRLERLAGLEEPAQRVRAFAFPRQLERVRFSLRRFVQVLFEPDATQESPLFRGFYLTSAVQEGTPADRVVEIEARHAGLPPVPVGRAATGPGPLFLRDLLSGVIFGDAGLATSSTRAERTRQRRRVLYAGGLAGAFVLLTILFSALSCANRGVIDATRRAAQNLSESLAQGSFGENLDALERLRTQLVRVDSLTRHKPLWRRLGGYSGDAILEPAWRLYTEAALRVLVKPAVDQLARELPARAAAREGRFIDFYESYRTWRLLSEAKALAPRDSVTVSRVLTHVFGGQLGATVGSLAAPPPRLLAAQVAYLTEHSDWLWKLEAGRVPPADPALIQPASARIRDEWSTGLAQFYGRMLDEVTHMEPRAPSVRVSSLLEQRNVPPSVLAAAGDDSVPGCFTREGWERQVKPLIEGYRADQNPRGGVLAEAFEGNLPDLADSLLALYARDYELHWLRFMDAPRVSDRPKPGVWSAQLALFAKKNESPIVAVLQVVDRETSLGEAAGSPLGTMENNFQVVHDFFRGQTGSAVLRPRGFWARVGGFFGGLWSGITGIFGKKRPPGSDQFASPKDTYLQYLEPVQQKVAEADRPGGDASSVVSDPSLAAARDWIQRYADAYGGRAAGSVGRLMRLPLRSASQQIPASPGLQADWAAVVLAFDKLRGRYPLAGGVQDDASPKDFADFFKPGGVFWSFYEAKLKSIAAPDGSPLPGQEGTALSGDFVASLRKAYQIRNAFEWKDTGPTVRFALRPSIPRKLEGPNVSLRRVFFDLGGDHAVYLMGSEGQPKDLEWPGPSPSEGAAIRAEAGSGPQPAGLVGGGPWGLFRLLDGHYESEGGTVRVSWVLTAGATKFQLVYELAPVSADHPFHPEFLRFSLPAAIQ